MDYKKAVFIILAISLSIGAYVILGVYFYDSFALFHNKNSMKKHFHLNDRYGVPHIINEKINDFNSLLLGTSLMRSTDGKWLDKDGKEFINLSLNGFPMYERGIALGYILKKKKLREVLYTLDLDLPFTRKTSSYKAFFEKNTLEHFYHSLSFYISNKKNLFCFLKLRFDDECLGTDIKNIGMPAPIPSILAKKGIRMDANLILFPKELEYKEDFNPQKRYDEKGIKKLLDNFDVDFLNYVRTNPQTEFKLIIPPSTRIFYRLDKLILDKIDFIKKLVALTKTYKNLKIYYFQNDDFTKKWHNFTYDLRHYPQSTNKLQIDAILAGTHILNAKNVDKIMAKFLKNTSEVDLRKLKKYFVSGEVNNQK